MNQNFSVQTKHTRFKQFVNFASSNIEAYMHVWNMYEWFWIMSCDSLMMRFYDVLLIDRNVSPKLTDVKFARLRSLLLTTNTSLNWLSFFSRQLMMFPWCNVSRSWDLFPNRVFHFTNRDTRFTWIPNGFFGDSNWIRQCLLFSFV